MKYIILFVFVMFSNILYAYEYQTHSIGISTSFQGVAAYSQAFGIQNFGVSVTSLDFYLGKRYGKTKYIPLFLQFRLSAPFVKTSEQYFIQEFRWGFLIGAAQYAFDFRSTETGIGWSMIINGGLGLDMPASSKRLKQLENSIIDLSIELEALAVYNFNKYAAVTIGLGIGYLFGYRYLNMPGEDQEGFPISRPTGLEFLNSFTYNLSIGFLF